MDNYKKIIPCIFIEHGKAVKWINDKEVLEIDSNQLYGSTPVYDGVVPNKPSNNDLIICSFSLNTEAILSR